jgi:hypothetical protein
MLKILLFFPAINFGLLSAEIFPWASIYSIKKRIINYRFLIITVMFSLSIYFSAIATNFIYLPEHLRSLFAYLNPIYIFFTLMAVSYEEIFKIKKMIAPLLLFLFFLGIIQFSGLISILEPFFNFLIPRSSASSLANIGRGVTLLSTEPSRAGYELLFLYAAWRALSSDRDSLLVLKDLLFFIYMIVIIQSALAVLLTLVYFAFVYKSRFGFLLLIIPILIFVVANFETRATLILRQIYPIITSPEIIEFFINRSGFRFVSIISAFNYGIYNIFGGGVGLWETTSIESFNVAGFDPTQVSYFVSQHGGQFVGVRPTSYASNLALDIGVFGLLIFILLFYKYIKRFIKLSASDKNIFYLFIFSFIFFGSVGNPVPWVLIALVLRIKEESRVPAYKPLNNYSLSHFTPA